MATDFKAMAIAQARAAGKSLVEERYTPARRDPERFLHETDRQFRSALADLLRILGMTTTAREVGVVEDLLRDWMDAGRVVQTDARMRRSAFISKASDPFEDL